LIFSGFFMFHLPHRHLLGRSESQNAEDLTVRRLNTKMPDSADMYSKGLHFVISNRDSREKGGKSHTKTRIHKGKTEQPQMNPPPLRFLLRPFFPELWRTRWRDRQQIYARGREMVKGKRRRTELGCGAKESHHLSGGARLFNRFAAA
jgi:hypothetical protein